MRNKYKTVFIKKRYSDQFDERKVLESHGKLISDYDRSLSLDRAEKKYNVAILDDGLQDKKINYDISIVCFNTTYGIGNGYLLPAGPLRENLEVLKKYNAIFLIGNKKNSKLSTKLKKFNKNLFFSSYLPTNLNNFDKKKNYIFFCGIGNPEEFENNFKNINLPPENPYFLIIIT